MAATISSDNDRVVISLDFPEKDILLTPDIAARTADALRFQSALADFSVMQGRRDALPTIDVEAVLVNKEPRVRLKFSRRIKTLRLSSKVAVEIACALRQAAEHAESSRPPADGDG